MIFLSLFKIGDPAHVPPGCQTPTILLIRNNAVGDETAAEEHAEVLDFKR